MSRKNDGTRVPMTAERRASILKEFVDATGYVAPFPSEVLQITIVRLDGPMNELVGVIEMDERGAHLHAGYDPATAHSESSTDG